MRLSTAVTEFLLHKATELARETLAGYKSDLNLLVALATVEASDTVLAFTPRLVDSYFARLSAKGLSMATLHRRRASVSEFAKWGVRRRLWAENPMADAPRIKRPKHKPRPFRHEERVRLLALDLLLPERAIRALLYWAGLRVSELCALRLADIAEGDGTAPGTLRIRGKGKKERVVPMVPQLREVLHEYIWTCTDLDAGVTGGTGQRSSFLFSHRAGEPWSRRMVEKRTRRWGVTAQVLHCEPHRFRHTTAQLMLERGVHPRRIQEWLGHEDLNTTMVYLDVSAGDLVEAARLLAGDPPGPAGYDG